MRINQSIFTIFIDSILFNELYLLGKYITDRYDILSVFDCHTKKAIRIGEMDHGDRYYFVCRNKA